MGGSWSFAAASLLGPVARLTSNQSVVGVAVVFTALLARQVQSLERHAAQQRRRATAGGAGGGTGGAVSAGAGPMRLGVSVSGLQRLRELAPGSPSSRVPAVGRVAPSLAAALVGAVFGGPLAALVFGAVALVGPGLAGHFARWRAEQAFEGAMPSLLDEMSRGMRAGLSPSSALQLAGSSAPAPFPGALRPATERLFAGEDNGAAVAAWSNDHPSPSLTLFATAVAVAGSVGGLHPRGVDSVAATIRERRAADAEVATQALQARLSAAVMTIAPLGFCGFLVLTDPRASHFLLRTTGGLVCALGGIGLDCLAAGWMARIARGPDARRSRRHRRRRGGATEPGGSTLRARAHR